MGAANFRSGGQGTWFTARMPVSTLGGGTYCPENKESTPRVLTSLFSVKCPNSRVSLPILSNFCHFQGKNKKIKILSHTIFDFLLENFFDQVTSKIYVKILQKHDKNMPKKTQTRGTPHLNDPSTHGYLLQFFADA